MDSRSSVKACLNGPVVFGLLSPRGYRDLPGFIRIVGIGGDPDAGLAALP